MPELMQRRHDHCGKHCPLYNAKIKCRHVPSEIVQRNAEGGIDLAFIAEAPGGEEDQQGRPLIGSSGKVLRSELAAIGATGLGYAFLNICRCRPTKLVDGRLKDRAPTPAERAACVPYLWEDLKQLRPKRIVALGATSIGTFVPHFKSVAEIHGQQLSARIQGFAQPFEVWPTYHPAAVLYDGSLRAYLKEDLVRALGKSDLARWQRPGKTKALLTVKDVKKFVIRLLTKLTPEHMISFDVETTSTERLKNRLLCIAFAYNDTTAYAIPYDHPKAPWTPKEFRQIRKLLQALFTFKHASFGYWVAHHSVFDMQVIRQNIGVFPINRPVLDSEWMFFGFDETRLSIGHHHPYALKQLLLEYLNWDPYDPVMLKLRSEGRMLEAALPRLLAYNGTDCYATIRLVQWLKQRARSYWPKLLRLAAKLMAPGQLALAQVELNGFAVDLELAQTLSSKHSPLQQHLADAEAWFRSYKPAQAVNATLARKFSRGADALFGKVPWVFSLRKQEHTIPLFIEALKLKPVNFGKKLYKGKPAPKIDKKFLATHKDHEAIQHLKTYRDLDKLMSSYVKSILRFLRSNADCNDGRIRSNFLTTRTLTGRLASKNPNLQQIPRKSDEKDALQAKTTIKNMFCATPGWALVSADYMQGEVYLLGQVSRDKNFCKLLWRIRGLMEEYEKHPSKDLAERIKNEGDVHRQTAALMFNVPVKDVTKDMRQIAKAIVFGLIYGKHVTTLAMELKIEVEEAEKKSDLFFSPFRDAQRWLAATEKLALKLRDGEFYVESELGRRRRFPRLTAVERDPRKQSHNDKQEIGKVQRRARNSPIQSLLSDIALHAAGRLQRYIWKHKRVWRLVDIVHDAIIAEVPVKEMPEYIAVCRQIMTDLTPIERDFAMKFVVPMNVEFEVGTHYGQLKGLEPGKAGLRAAMIQVAREWQLGFAAANDQKTAETKDDGCGHDVEATRPHKHRAA